MSAFSSVHLVFQQRDSRAFLSQDRKARAEPTQEFELHRFIVGYTRLGKLFIVLLDLFGKHKRIIGLVTLKKWFL